MINYSRQLNLEQCPILFLHRFEGEVDLEVLKLNSHKTNSLLINKFNSTKL